MSTVSEILANNYLLQEDGRFDRSLITSKDPNVQVLDKHKSQSYALVALAEAVEKVAHYSLVALSAYHVGRPNVISIFGRYGLITLIFWSTYDQEPIQFLIQKKSYRTYLTAKAECLACLPAKEQAMWLLKDLAKSLFWNIAGAQIIHSGFLSPGRNIHFFAACVIANLQLLILVSDIYQRAHNAINVAVYNFEKKQFPHPA